jgi:hypothetical protein
MAMPKLWDHMTANEQLAYSAAVRRGDRAAAAQHWMAALVRIGNDVNYDAAVRAWARSHFKPEARRRLFAEGGDQPT